MRMTILDWNLQRIMQGGTTYVKGGNYYKYMNVKIHRTIIMFSSSRAVKWCEDDIGDQITCEVDGADNYKDHDCRQLQS